MGHFWRHDKVFIGSVLIPLCAIFLSAPPLTGMSDSWADSLLRAQIRPTATPENQVSPQRPAFRSHGFYNTDERMGVGMIVRGDLRVYEFTWARIPLRRFSVGIWTEMDIDDNEIQRSGALGGGLSVTLFPFLSKQRRRIGLYVNSRFGGIQHFDEHWGKHGGVVRGHGEMGAYSQIGSGILLIPRAAVRVTGYRDMRKGKLESTNSEISLRGGLELRVANVIPGVFVLTSAEETAYAFTLRFAYQ